LVRKGAKNDMKINNDFVLSDAIYIPEINEQLKIVEFLGLIDRKLNLIDKKLKNLIEYKKGILQKIFSQEVRFKNDEGKYFSEWKDVLAGKIFKNNSNKNHNGELTVLAATQENGMVPRASIGIEIKSSEKSIKSYKIVEKGDFVISLRSFQGGIEYSEYYGICSPAYTILKPKIEINHAFFKFYFKKDSFIERLSKTVVGIRDGKQISYTAFAGLKLKLPPIKEQEKIADLITNIDNQIKNTEIQLNYTKEYKKALLQKMYCN
jgi:type I restriction enzyme S subunit